MPVLSHELQVQLPSLRRLSARVGSSASFRSAVANEAVAVVVRGHLHKHFCAQALRVPTVPGLASKRD